MTESTTSATATIATCDTIKVPLIGVFSDHKCIGKEDVCNKLKIPTVFDSKKVLCGDYIYDKGNVVGMDILSWDNSDPKWDIVKSLGYRIINDK